MENREARLRITRAIVLSLHAQAVEKLQDCNDPTWIVEKTPGYTQATHFEQDPTNGAESVTIVQFTNPDSCNKRRGLRVLSVNFLEGKQTSYFEDYTSILKSGKPFARSRMRYIHPGVERNRTISITGEPQAVLIKHMVNNLPKADASRNL